MAVANSNPVLKQTCDARSTALEKQIDGLTTWMERIDEKISAIQEGMSGMRVKWAILGGIVCALPALVSIAVLIARG